MYTIRINPVIKLQPILQFNEMSFWINNRSATELIYFYGIWSTSGDDENSESHFSTHFQSVTIYKITEDTVLTLTPGDGLTKNKYDFHDYENREKTPPLSSSYPFLLVYSALLFYLNLRPWNY